jgi:photosystem II stability/assembly factor-like uncharacterized protein
MKSATAALVVGTATAQEWRVTKPFFSAVTIGIDFQDDMTGWTTQSDGSELPRIIKTEDGGDTWHDVDSSSGKALLPISVAAAKGAKTDVAVFGPIYSSEYSRDGNNFQQTIGGGFVGQDVKFQAGRMVQTTSKGVCISESGGEFYRCHDAPLKYPGTARYSSSPEKGIIYLTSGSWPMDDSANGQDEFWMARNVRLNTKTGALKLGSAARATNDTETYQFELLKSTDDGKTWTSLMSDEGNYYPNDIHCFDATHCTMVAEGFAQDGSMQPGAHVFHTTDGENFNIVHTEADLGSESFMTVRMVSATEYWAGGAANPGAVNAPSLLIHSADGGQTHENRGDRDDLYGEYISSMSFVSPEHGWATSLNAASTCNLMEFGGTTPPAPAPAPPTPGQPHYEAPPCKEDELEVGITGIDGRACVTPCYASGGCPSDTPDGVSAIPACALSDSSTGSMYCTLLCLFDAQCDKAGGAACNGGLCTYNTTSAANSIVLTPTSERSISV